MIYLGLGSNIGNRRTSLADALKQLQENGFKIDKVSPLVESPALLMAEAKPEWNRPYLNLVVRGETKHPPHELLRLVKKIEQKLGRNLSAPRWSPRPIDIDLLLWGDQQIDTNELVIPHPRMCQRAFVITPLLHLAPECVIPGKRLTVQQISQQIRPIPLWMGIVNLTPDSFSDGGVHDDLSVLEQQLDGWIRAGVQLLDFGAESTRPNAEAVSDQQEQQRLNDVFPMLKRLAAKHRFMPLISIDTRHASTAKLALLKGADWINDVTGLRDVKLLDVVREQHATAVAMHSLGVPVDPLQHLDTNRPIDGQLSQWLEQKAEWWVAQGLDISQIVFDPGIGFGKTALQNMDIIKTSASLRKHGFRLLMGHSRKSFMNSFADEAFADRDLETLGLSLAMCEQGVDIIRVHAPLMHIRAYRAWSHARAC